MAVPKTPKQIAIKLKSLKKQIVALEKKKKIIAKSFTKIIFLKNSFIPNPPPFYIFSFMS